MKAKHILLIAVGVGVVYWLYRRQHNAVSAVTGTEPPAWTQAVNAVFDAAKSALDAAKSAPATTATSDAAKSASDATRTGEDDVAWRTDLRSSATLAEVHTSFDGTIETRSAAQVIPLPDPYSTARVGETYLPKYASDAVLPTDATYRDPIAIRAPTNDAQRGECLACGTTLSGFSRA